MKDVWLDSERGERFHTSDAKHDFLAHTHLEIAAVEFCRDAPVLRAVLRDVGVEQIDVHASDAQFPHLSENFSIQNRHRNEMLHFAMASFADRQVVKTLVQINRRLNAVLIDLLPEIAMAIQEAN